MLDGDELVAVAAAFQQIMMMARSSQQGLGTNGMQRGGQCGPNQGQGFGGNQQPTARGRGGGQGNGRGTAGIGGRGGGRR